MIGKKRHWLLATLEMALSACGGGRDGPVTGDNEVVPKDIILSTVTAGFMAGAGTVQVAAGQSVNHGDIEFSRAAGGADCSVIVMVDENGDITATSS